MQDGSRQQGQGITFATNAFTKQDCIFLAKILAPAPPYLVRRLGCCAEDKYALKTSPPLCGCVAA
jgi:hypothetical protein